MLSNDCAKGMFLFLFDNSQDYIPKSREKSICTLHFHFNHFHFNQSVFSMIDLMLSIEKRLYPKPVLNQNVGSSGIVNLLQCPCVLVHVSTH